jgi:hypothetical protein
MCKTQCHVILLDPINMSMIHLGVQTLMDQFPALKQAQGALGKLQKVWPAS